MALNRYFAEANQVSLPVPNGAESGDPVVIGTGDLHGVLLVDEGDSEEGFATVQLDGAFLFELDGPIDAGDSVTGALVGATEHLDGDDSTVFGVALKSLENGETAEIPVRLSN